jgi:hypothetical protein
VRKKFANTIVPGDLLGTSSTGTRIVIGVARSEATSTLVLLIMCSTVEHGLVFQRVWLDSKAIVEVPW